MLEDFSKMKVRDYQPIEMVGVLGGRSTLVTGGYGVKKEDKTGHTKSPSLERMTG